MKKLVIATVFLVTIGAPNAESVPVAAAQAPAWSINTVAEPTTFNGSDTTDATDEVTVTATAGTYELHPSSLAAVTEPIAWNASAQEVEEALGALPGVGQGNVSVTGGPGDASGSKPYTVTWDGRLSGASPGELQESEAQLINGLAEGAVTIRRTRSERVRDRYLVTVTNVGDAPSSGEITLRGDVAKELVPHSVQAEEVLTGVAGECFLAELQCIYREPVRPGRQLRFEIAVAVPNDTAPGTLTAEATVSGGGALPATSHTTTPINAGAPRFGISGFSVQAAGVGGSGDEQAGGHPSSLITTLDLNTRLANEAEESTKPYSVVEEAKDVSVELPLGVVGDPLAAERCPVMNLANRIGSEGHFAAPCPKASQVGIIWLTWDGGVTAGPFPLYNVVPEHGYPAELGFNAVAVGVYLYTTIVPSKSGYRLRIATPGALRAQAVEDVSVIVFGSPGEHDGAGGTQAFITNPTSCSQPLSAAVEVSAWEGGPTGSAEAVAYPQVTGCNLLQSAAAFDPSVAVEPETTQADTPSGYVVDLRIPQGPNAFGALATPYLKNAAITLPAGVSISPSAANGPDALSGCTAAQIDLLGTEVGEGHPGGKNEQSPYDDGLIHAAPGHCPENSRLGEVEAKTPDLAEPLHGHMYLAEPQCGGSGQPACTEAAAEKGEVFGVYLEVSGSGVIVKQPGTVEVGGYGAHSRETGLTPGQVRVRFDEAPQFPLEEVKVTFPGGQRTPLANPQTCGTATTTSELEPWSAPESGPNATPSSSFAVTGCSTPMSFKPGFTAGTVTSNAGGYSPFVLQLSRNDGEQDLSGLETTLPGGLLAKLAGVPECGDAEAKAGSCPSDAQIGTVTTTLGPGSEPLTQTGKVYLTGPYNGGPFGEVVVVPAIAGPFNLGNVVVRGSIRIDPNTAKASIVSDPLPQFVDGVPVRLRTVDVEVNRPGFTFNPTACDAKAVIGTLTAVQGASETVSSPFAVVGCANLPFKPVFKASTQAQTSRVNGASLVVKVAPKPGEANIHKVHLAFPKALPARLATLRLACTEAQFAANPAGCPAGSAIGTGTAITPVLGVPLSGPAYLVSHGGAAYPDVVFVLQGDGVKIDLTGHTNIKKGVTYSTFETVPDAPVTSFETVLPEGPHAIFGANLPPKAKGSFCGRSPVIATTLEGQNGAVINQNTKLKITGCPKKPKHHPRRKGPKHRKK